jgi:uncharacterized protein (DUF58 family)
MLDQALLASIADLELVARVTVDGSVSGLHRSPFHGYSAEFSQYRHYRQGDDLKYVDWKLFARTDRFYTKQYRETTNLLAEIAVDASASMAFRGSASSVSKFEYARMLAAALAYLIAGQGDAVGLVAYDVKVREYIASRTGQTHLRRLLMSLSKLEPSGETAAAAALKRSIDLLKRRGLLILLSDLYDDGEDVEAELRRAVRIGHEVAVFHVLTSEEIEFPYSGDLEIEDLESGRRRLTSGTVERAAYRERFAAFLERWRTRCLSYGIDYAQVTTDTPPDKALREYLLRRDAALAR